MPSPLDGLFQANAPLYRQNPAFARTNAAFIPQNWQVQPEDLNPTNASSSIQGTALMDQSNWGKWLDQAGASQPGGISMAGGMFPASPGSVGSSRAIRGLRQAGPQQPGQDNRGAEQGYQSDDPGYYQEDPQGPMNYGNRRLRTYSQGAAAQTPQAPF